MNNKKVLVFGGNKFVGLHLIDELVQRFKAQNIFSLTRSGQISKVNSLLADRHDEQSLKQALEKHEFDLVFDLSAYQLEDLEPSFNLLKNRVQTWVLMSSAGVYAKSNIFPLQINFSTINEKPHIGKLQCEQFLRSQSIQSFCLRPFYIYGPHNSFDRETFFFRALEAEQTILLPNDGSALLQFASAGEIARLMVELALLPAIQTQKGIFNIGDKNLYSLNSLIQTCAEIIGKKAKIEYFSPSLTLPARDIFPLRAEHYFGDLSELHNLGLQTQVELSKGLEQTYKWFKENRYLYPKHTISPAGADYLQSKN